jgi:hypothetical protein
VGQLVAVIAYELAPRAQWGREESPKMWHPLARAALFGSRREKEFQTHQRTESNRVSTPFLPSDTLCTPRTTFCTDPLHNMEGLIGAAAARASRFTDRRFWNACRRSPEDYPNGLMTVPVPGLNV